MIDAGPVRVVGSSIRDFCSLENRVGNKARQKGQLHNTNECLMKKVMGQCQSLPASATVNEYVLQLSPRPPARLCRSPYSIPSTRLQTLKSLRATQELGARRHKPDYQVQRRWRRTTTYHNRQSPFFRAMATTTQTKKRQLRRRRKQRKQEEKKHGSSGITKNHQGPHQAAAVQVGTVPCEGSRRTDKKTSPVQRRKTFLREPIYSVLSTFIVCCIHPSPRRLFLRTFVGMTFGHSVSFCVKSLPSSPSSLVSSTHPSAVTAGRIRDVLSVAHSCYLFSLSSAM
jgi:hypothetical protein